MYQCSTYSIDLHICFSWCKRFWHALRYVCLLSLLVPWFHTQLLGTNSPLLQYVSASYATNSSSTTQIHTYSKSSPFTAQICLPHHIYALDDTNSTFTSQIRLPWQTIPSYSSYQSPTTHICLHHIDSPSMALIRLLRHKWCKFNFLPHISPPASHIWLLQHKFIFHGIIAFIGYPLSPSIEHICLLREVSLSWHTLTSYDTYPSCMTQIHLTHIRILQHKIKLSWHISAL